MDELLESIEGRHALSGSPSGGHRAGERDLSQSNWLCRAGQGPVRALTGANLPTIRLEPQVDRKKERLPVSTTNGAPSSGLTYA